MQVDKQGFEKLLTELQFAIEDSESVIRKLPLDQIHTLAEKVLPYTIGGDTDSIDLLLGPLVAKYAGVSDDLLKQLTASINFARYLGKEKEAQELEKDLEKLGDLQSHFTERLLELLHKTLDNFWKQFGVKESTVRFSQDPPAISQLIAAKKIYLLHNFGGELTAKNIGEKRTDPEYTKKILPKLVYLSMGLLLEYESEDSFIKKLIKNILPIVIEAYKLLCEFDFSVSISQSVSEFSKYKTLTQASKGFIAYEAIRFLAQKMGSNLPPLEFYERGAMFFTKPSRNLLKFTDFWKKLLPKPVDVRPIVSSVLVYILAENTKDKGHDCPSDPNAYLAKETRFSCVRKIFQLFKATPLDSDDRILEAFFTQIILPSSFDTSNEEHLDIVRNFVEIDYAKSIERILSNYLTILLGVDIPVPLLLKGAEVFMKQELNDNNFDLWYSKVKYALASTKRRR